MKKGSSGNRRKRKPPVQETSRYPTRDNVYSLQRERQRRQAQEERQAREWQQAQMGYAQTPHHSTKRKKHKRKRRGSQMMMPLVVFAIIALYLVGQIGGLVAKRSDIDVETVAYGTIDTPEIYTGLILREEYVVESSRDGQPYYQYSQGDYVPKGAVVCTVKDTDSTDELESKLKQIDKDILKSQKARTDLSAFSEDISRLEDNVSRTVDAYAGRSMRASLSYMYTLKSQVASFMDQRNEIWLTENVDSLSQLTEEKNVYEKQLAQNQSALSAAEAGVLCLSYDGMEKKLTPEQAEKVTKKQIGDSKTQYISKAKSVAKGDPLFKIITDNKWYVVAYLPNNAVTGWEAGKTSRTLNMLTEEETYQISADVEALTAGEKETKVVFSSYEHMEDFMEGRTVSFSLEGAVKEGLKIPNDAIVEKSLLKIPRDCLTESMGNTGVLLIKGSSTKFTDISVVTGDEEAVYIETGDGSLKTGDVVLQGTGEAATQVTLSELKPHTGVYVANSSVAKFAVVEIIEQNQEYAIVKAGSTTGLQAYDTIVSDAKNIKEGESIF
nr:HlyD family efflux transporter periplasmic adaptor subunit [uncultured Anaerotignum sp.]